MRRRRIPKRKSNTRFAKFKFKTKAVNNKTYRGGTRL